MENPIKEVRLNAEEKPTVSGGNTTIYLANSYVNITILNDTMDDAIGEVYDKVARLCSIPYPGGVLLDKMAHNGNKNAFNFPEARVGEDEFSFSGLKTAVLREVKKFNPEHLKAFAELHYHSPILFLIISFKGI